MTLTIRYRNVSPCINSSNHNRKLGLFKRYCEFLSCFSSQFYRGGLPMNWSATTRRSLVLQILCGLLLGAISVPAPAQFVDNFDYANNATLEAVWGTPVVGGATGTSFTYNTGSGTLNATELIDSDVGGFATAKFSQPTSFSGDFVGRAEFDWNQSLVLGVMFVEFRGAAGLIASGGLGDDTGASGHAYMQVGGNSTYVGPNGEYLGTFFEAQTGAIATSFNNAPIVSGAADAVRAGYALGDTGSARLDVVRFGSQLRVVVSDGTNQFSLGPITGSTDDITSVDIVFGGFAFGGPANHLVGDTGTHIALSTIELEVAHGPGDANGVGGVTIEDYLLIRANSFTSQILGRNGDVNYDGLVDFADFREWKANFPGGEAAAEAAIAALAVPEPTSLVLCGIAGTILLVVARRKSNR